MNADRDSGRLVLPPALLAAVEAAADEEHRPAAEMLRVLVERGLDQRRWQAHSAQERQRARTLGLAEDDQPKTDAYRHVVRDKIAQGVRSLRDGNVVDGEAFMAQMDAELAGLERQGRE